MGQSRTVTGTSPPTSWAEDLRRSDGALLKSLYTAHFPAVQQFVLRNRGRAEDARDVFQEAITVLWLKAKDGALQDTTEPGAFLYRVARNKWLDRVRSASHRNMRVVEVEHIAASEGDERMETELRLIRLRKVYGQMDERCRSVLGRFYFERQDLATIAGAMDVSEESIRTIKYRCMMKLRAFRKQIEGGTDRSEP